MKHNIVNKEDYKYYFQKKLKYPVNAEMAAYMRSNQEKCVAISKDNPNENWFHQKLKIAKLPVKFNRQTLWGYRIYDFWCHSIGCAVEIDGPEHDPNYDRYRDIYNYLRSVIIIIRVRNKHEEDANEAIAFIKTVGKWSERRLDLGIDTTKSIGNIDITRPDSTYWKR